MALLWPLGAIIWRQESDIGATPANERFGDRLRRKLCLKRGGATAEVWRGHGEAGCYGKGHAKLVWWITYMFSGYTDIA